MITKVVLHNFQSHKHSEFDFSSGVNAIIGLSDVGKSSLLRALSWVITNKPLGLSFISEFGAGDCYVEVTIDNHVITRVRGTTTNKYVVDGKEFTAMGQNVPPQVSVIFNFSELNIMSQMSDVFLLNLSPGAVAKLLNDICGLSDIDVMQQNANATIRDIDSKLKVLRDKDRTTTDKLAKLDYVDALQTDLDFIIYKHAQVLELSKLCDEIASVLDKIDSLHDSMSKYQIANADAYVNSLHDLLSQVNKTKDIRLDVVSIIDKLLALQARHAGLLAILQNQVTVDAIASLQSKRLDLIHKKQVLLALCNSIRDLRKKLASATFRLKNDSSQLQQVIPDVCPLCGMRGGNYYAN